MKKLYYILLSAVAIASLSSCEKDLPLYEDQQAKLNFNLTTSSFNDDGSLKPVGYSFVYEPSTVVEDTIFVKITTMGFLSDQDRALSIKQVPAGSGYTDAVAGTHYKSFDEMGYCIKADSCEAFLPVVIYRDASLQNEDVYLRLQIVDNENFTVGYEQYKEYLLTISDQLSKPTAWDQNFLQYYIGPYCKNFHRFCIDITGKKWDNDWINANASDFNYLSYLANYLYKKLAEYNAEQEAKGLSPLLDDDGNVYEMSTYLLQ